ncbi:MAG: hypothetical protein ACLQVY_17725 [Limisphaerales bacterium]
MNREEAKQILALYRPGTADEQDPSFQEALQFAQDQPEMTLWFQEHCESYLVLRRKLRAVPVPSGLKERILSERKIRRGLFERYWAPLLAAAAALVLMAGISFWPGTSHRVDAGHAAYRKRMTETGLRGYAMDLSTSDPSQVRRFLKMKNAPADYTLPAGLQKTELAGCAVLHWQGAPVSMVCFKTGRVLPPGNQSDLWFFVADRNAVPKAPSPGAPVIARVNKATTASWSDEKKNYLLAAVGDEAFLEKYLR